MALIPNKKRVRTVIKTPETPIQDVLTDDNETFPDENWSNDEPLTDQGKPNLVSEQNRVLPKPPGKHLTFAEIMKYLGEFTDDHWKHAMVYVYRKFPKINKRQVDPDAQLNIDKISAPITKEEFINRHGGGTYRIIVNDLDAGYDKKGRTVCYTVFNIDWNTYPPILNPAELDVYAEGNKFYVNHLIAKGVIDGTTMAVITPGSQANANIGDMASVLMKMVDQNQANIRNIIEANRNSSNSSEAIQLQKIISEERSKREDLLIKMMEDKGSGGMDMLVKMLELVKPSETGGNGQIELMKQMMQMQKDHSEMMMKILLANKESEPKPTKTFAEQLQEFKEVGELMGMGNGGGTRRTVAGEFFDMAKEVLPNVINAIGSYFAFKAGGTVPGVTIQQPQAPVTQTQSNLPQQIEQPAMDLKTQANILIQQYGSILVNLLDNGYDGHGAAQTIIDSAGMNTFAQVVALGKENVIEAAKANPAFWQRASVAVKGEENLLTWINEFFEGPEEEGEDEDNTTGN